MSASRNAIGHARAQRSDRIAPDHLLLGALEAAANLGVAVLGPLVIDLYAFSDLGEEEGTEATPVRPKYAPDTAAVFDRAARIAREDGEKKVRLAAFGRDESELMDRLMSRYGFDHTAWRAALVEWDRASNGAGGRRPENYKVLSVDDAADTLGLHAQTIRGYIRSGKLPAYRIGGGSGSSGSSGPTCTTCSNGSSPRRTTARRMTARRRCANPFRSAFHSSRRWFHADIRGEA